jgi:hypothetical protein
MPNSSQHIPASATIAASGTTSDARNTGRASRGSFQIPSAFTGTNCAVHVSNDGTNFVACPVEGNEVITQTVATNGSYSFPIKTFNFKYFRFVVDAQATARTITLFTRE